MQILFNAEWMSVKINIHMNPGRRQISSSYSIIIIQRLKNKFDVIQNITIINIVVVDYFFKKH